MHLHNRAPIIQQFIDGWYDVNFEWGMRDCVCLAVSALWVLGFKVNFKTGMYKNETGAIRAIRKAGYNNLIEAIDDQEFLERVPVASAVIGDIIGMKLPEIEIWPALAIAVGNGRVLGFYDHGDGFNKCIIMQPKILDDCIAWRAS